MFFPGAFMHEAAALMKVVKLTLMKVTSELAAKKKLSSMEQHNRNGPRAARHPEQDQVRFYMSPVFILSYLLTHIFPDIVQCVGSASVPCAAMWPGTAVQGERIRG